MSCPSSHLISNPHLKKVRHPTPARVFPVLVRAHRVRGYVKRVDERAGRLVSAPRVPGVLTFCARLRGEAERVVWEGQERLRVPLVPDLSLACEAPDGYLEF